MKTPWDFVERYYPNYDSSDEIAQSNDLELLKEQGKLTKEKEALYNEVHLSVFSKAIDNFISLSKS